MSFMFEKLEVYQKAVTFTERAISITHDFPRGYGFLSNQFNRASLSIATNLAEANGRFTRADRKHFFIMARGSTQECVPLLEIAHRRSLLPSEVHEALRHELETIARMIAGLINGLDKRKT